MHEDNDGKFPDGNALAVAPSGRTVFVTGGSPPHPGPTYDYTTIAYRS